MRKVEEQIKYVCDTEDEAREAVEHFAKESITEGYVLAKNGYEYKSKKAKGEIVDEKWVLTIKKQISGIFDEE